jgi:hypothetical protein
VADEWFRQKYNQKLTAKDLEATVFVVWSASTASTPDRVLSLIAL